MTSYVVNLMQCPDCACQFTSWAVASCNGFGARFYTDGFVYGSMYDGGSKLLICPGCHAYLWRDGVPVLESVRDIQYFEDEKFREMPHGIDVRGRRYEEVLQKRLWRSEAQERYVRVRAWWSFNRGYRGEIDGYRDPDDVRQMFRELAGVLRPEDEFDSELQEELRQALARNEAVRRKFAENHLTLDMVPPRDLPPDQTENLERLVEILDRQEPGAALLRAEALRELGHFERCLRELELVDFDEDMNRIAARIRELALQRRRRVELLE